MRWRFNSLEGNEKSWRRIIVPISYAKPDPTHEGVARIFYEWELDQPAVVVDQKSESWSFVRSEPLQIIASSYIVNREGVVVNPRIACSSSPAVDAPALDLIRNWKYRPGIREGNLVWSYAAGFVVMPKGRRIQPKLIFSVDDLPQGAELPKLIKEGSTVEYRTLPDYKAIRLAMVLLDFTVGADGKVLSMRSLAATDPKATHFAKLMCASAVYEPGKINGKPVAMEVIKCFAFTDSVERLWDEN